MRRKPFLDRVLETVDCLVLVLMSPPFLLITISTRRMNVFVLQVLMLMLQVFSLAKTAFGLVLLLLLMASENHSTV